MKVLVAMSGGVDSSVAAALLKEQGHEVAGVFMRNWTNEGKKMATLCPWADDERDVREVGKILGLPTYLWDFQSDYQDLIFNPFLAGLEEGLTPNPDCACNRYIKFGVLLDRAREAGYEALATGHYARRLATPTLSSVIPNLPRTTDTFDTGKNGIQTDTHLATGLDSNKDQSYFLSQITREQLEFALFPVGELIKKEVRAVAKKYKLPVADKPDSQGLCFVGRIKVADFLRANLEKKAGEIRNIDTNEIIGGHDGVWFYTIGQRHGLNIGGGLPYFVAKKDLANNILYVAPGPNHPSLFLSECAVKDLHWLVKVELPLSCQVRARYRQPLQPATLSVLRNTAIAENGNTGKLTFSKPQRALTPGQVVAFYNNDIVLGSAVISLLAPVVEPSSLRVNFLTF